MNSKPSNGPSLLKQKKSSLPHVVAKGQDNQQKKSCSALIHSNEAIKLTGKLKNHERKIKKKAKSFKPEKPLQENGDMPIIIEHAQETDERTTEHDHKLKEIREKREKIKEGLYEKLLRDKPNCEYKNESKLTSPWMKEEKDGFKKIEHITHFRAEVDKQLQEKAICQANELQRDGNDYLKTIKVKDEIMQKDLDFKEFHC
ncbi:hypothetical protein AAG570_007602 [Ranatra chinensis]|uniref:Uncharacterized protein n=1 Tax=Ranatra chinensis TaxID=642074 RepID=A0ABD0Y994_9HEMI